MSDAAKKPGAAAQAEPPANDGGSGGEQLPLLAPSNDRPAWTPASNSTTSLAAANEITRSGGAKRQRMQVLRQIVRSPSTDDDIAAALGIDGNSVRPRRYELVEERMVEATGGKRKTRRGRNALVYRATELGKLAARNAK